MNNQIITSKSVNFHNQGYQYILEKNYEKAIVFYEEKIASHPTIISCYWYLGLALLLQGQEIEAQMAWMFPLADVDSEELQYFTAELIDILQSETERLESSGENRLAWVIRQHIKEIDPEDVNNLLHIIRLSSNIDILEDDVNILLSQATDLLKLEHITYNANVLLQGLERVLEVYFRQEPAFDFVFNCILQLNNPSVIIPIICNKARLFVKYLSSIKLEQFSDLCLHLAQDNINLLASITNLYQDANQYLESLKFAEKISAYSSNLEDEIASYYLMLRGLIQTVDKWEEVQVLHQKYENKLITLIQSDNDIDKIHLVNFLSTVVFKPYLRDNPSSNHYFRNQVAKFCQYKLQSSFNLKVELFKLKEKSQSSLKSNKVLKIGYISTCLRRHSVGWLARWIFQYHDKDKFQVYAYSLQQTNDNLQQDILQQCFQFRDLSSVTEIIDIANQIYEDEIDILIDLDSVTSRKVCGVMALKPAPIQVTWLGSDASGLPAIDYFIADPYVLPESADNYYASAIWRLPNTYVAVDGFEVGVPTLRREQLNIPKNAVVYLSSQTSYKRHPDTARLQVRILKQVPESYLLIKGHNDQDSMKKFFEQIAQEEGVDCSSLRFLPQVYLESVHRANLCIADVVLDTYPYNGATTTLETLWMGIPLVTKVGEQFAARNSYTMMVNAGISEGIAWTDEEYIEWGVRLGKEESLRQKIVWKLQQSRQNSPLWNAKQFTCEMEDAYEQMWQRYLQQT